MTRHLLVIGAQRCGTTYLHDLLAAHPDIAMARPARPEPKVFLSEDLVERGPDWYRKTFFAHATREAVLGEKSTSYLEFPEVPSRVARLLGSPLILVQLRDPVRRAVSNWSFSTESGLETRSLDDALSTNLEGPRPWDRELTSVSPFAYVERGRYTDYLGPWLERFGADVTVLLLEEMVAEPGRVGDLYAALGVDPSFRPARLGAAVNESEHPAAELDRGLRARLRDYYRESDATLQALLGRPLPWPGREK